MAQLALAWLLAKPVVSTVIVGASKLSQLENNVAAADVSLSAEEVAQLDAATAPATPYPQWFIQNLVDAKHRDALSNPPS